MKAEKFAAGISAAALAMSVMTFAAAAEEPCVYFTAIKSALGQGFTVEPVSVPLYEGDKGVDVVKRAVGEDNVLLTESDYGAYITGFADTDTGAEIPAEIAAVCPEMTGRSRSGFLSAYDYTAESGWSFFINGEYAQVGISDYEPRNGDVLEFRFSVYGYGADLGIDNSVWGGAAALTEQIDASQLIRNCAAFPAYGEDPAETETFLRCMDTLAKYGITQEEINRADLSLTSGHGAEIPFSVPDNEGISSAEEKGSPDTGAGGIAVMLGAALLAGCAAVISGKVV